MNPQDPAAAPQPDTEPPPALQHRSRVIPYVAVKRHGIIGDRRTAALVAADGTVDWLCLPDFDGQIVFGALLDALKGGYWRLGPARMLHGQQDYQPESMVLETRWELPQGTLVLQDAMLWPEPQRAPEQANVRVLVRCLKCLRGQVRCEQHLQPGYNFHALAVSIAQYGANFSFQVGDFSLRLWSSEPPQAAEQHLHGEFDLKAGQELWSVLDVGAAGQSWSADSARSGLEGVRRYWRQWVEALHATSRQDLGLQRSAMLVHLLTSASHGSVVAAPTTSVPQRIGGSWNADYRYCWVRDASLAVGMLAWLGNLRETEQYLRWLTQRLPYFGQPLQVLYDIRGEKRPRQQQLSEAAGYRNSQPVTVGNHAYKQFQLGSYGYLADCVWIYLREGGQWREEYWNLITRLAGYTVKNWEKAENGIWELPERRHFLSSKVLSWVMLDRAIQIARKVQPAFDTAAWQSCREAIRAEVLERGWCERLRAFRQDYEAENLDAAALLIPVLEFLPAQDPRVLATLERIVDNLSIEGLVYRFDPMQTPGLGKFPLGQMEGAFFPCTFWMATAYAKAGQVERAEELVARAEDLAGPLRLFSEAADPRNHAFLGNTPLLFSHVEYVRAKLDIARAKEAGQTH